MYMLMLDRLKVSILNNKVDEEDNFFILYSIESLIEDMKKGRNTIIKIKKELSEFNLIKETRRYSEANRIYINIDILNSSTTKKQEEQKTTKKRVNYKKILDTYNKIEGVQKCVKLTEERKKHINARIKEYDLKTVFDVLEKVNKSDFLRGKNNKWNASIDFIFSPDGFIKILEDKYINKQPKSNTEQNSTTNNGNRKMFKFSDELIKQVFGED